MPEYLSPGVYIEEVNSGPRPIEGVGTTTAAFVGFAAAGPVGTPTLVTNWTQYVEAFGVPEADGSYSAHLDGAYLSHAVFGFFNNGGSRCYITRVAPGGGAADASVASVLQLPSRSARNVPSLAVAARGEQPGPVSVEVLPATPDAPEGSFTVKVRRDGTEEIFENLTLGRRNPRFAPEVINATSILIEVRESATVGSLSERAPEPGVYQLAGAAATGTSLNPASFVGDVRARSGVEGLEVLEDITMVACPDLMSAYQRGMIDRDGVRAVQAAMIAHCERMGDRIALLDALPDLDAQDVRRWRQHEANHDSRFAALYYPWVRVAGPQGHPLDIPPSGHVAGIFARSDTERGVHKAPANEVIRGALEPVVQLTRGEQDTLNPMGVNCIRTFAGMGVRVWGARTLSSDPAWRYVSVRRLFNFVMRSVERGTQWVVFEPNDPNLWARVRRDITSFLTTVWRDGALFGSTPNEAFFVKCDAELNPPEVRDQGRLVIEVGLAPVKPAEFVIFRFHQHSDGA